MSASTRTSRHGSREPQAPTPRARWWTVATLAILVGSLAGGPTADATLPRTSTDQASPQLNMGPETSARELRALVQALNRHRESIGCKPLILDKRLARLARNYSETMARENFFGHYDPSGADPFDRMRHAGIDFRAAGENLAFGQTRGLQVYDDWMNSPKHRAVIEDCVYTHYGIGLCRRRWSLLCARY